MQQPKTLRLVLGDQLNETHSWFREPEQRVTYVLMEVKEETDSLTQHIQKVTGLFAARRRFAGRLEAMGHRVVYLRLDDPANRQGFERNIRRLVQDQGFSRFEYLLPDDFRLDSRLKELALSLPAETKAADSEHFLTARLDVRDFFQGKKRCLMEAFYRHLRRKHGILLEGAKPLGGKWNFDRSNRSSYDHRVRIPEPLLFANDVREVVGSLNRMRARTFGRIDPERFIWPLDRRQSLQVLEEFLENRLPWFGTYQDAMTVSSWSLFHSRLSFALNTKMLNPMEVISGAVQRAARSREPAVGIEQLEGFVRQVLGWREYIRGIYWAHMPEYAGLNFFAHHRPLPWFYWTAETRMRCVSNAVAQSLEKAYAHHIQRLMVTGNFALLAGIHPDEVEAWYLGIYIDALEWVEMVNTRGMSQFADGGLVATKPYAASAHYLHTMSDYCQGCFYLYNLRTGERACPLNSLFWDFLHRHREKLKPNPRIGMLYRTWDRMAAGERQAVLRQAGQYLNDLERL